MIKNSKTHHHKARERSNENRHQHILGNTTSPLVDWFLVQKTGTIAFKLNPFCVILIGSEQCDINIQSSSVEKRHAVLCFDPTSDRFSVKDLNSTNGTFLNNRRISSDRPEELNTMDLLRFGYDSNLYEIRLGSASGPGVQQNEQRNVTYSPTTSDPGFSAGGTTPERFSHVMQQSGRGNSLYGSRVSSPSLTLDSGRGSSSAPSSPAKEMSPVSNLASSNFQSSPSFSRKIAKPQDSINNSSNQKGHNLSGSGDLRLTYSAKNILKTRKDSLEDEISNAVDKIMFPQSIRPPSRCSLNAVNSDLEADLNVPNEIFGDNLKPKLQEMDSSEASASFKQDGMSRPRSFSGDSPSGNAPRPNAPSPLYGVYPHWWPQDENYSPNDDNDDEHDEPPSVSQIIRDDRTDVNESNIMEKLSVHSESNKSIDLESDSQSDPAVTEGKKYEPMAFTVDFDDGPKKFGIAEPISKFVPRHRRNLSSTKTDELASKKETDDSSRKEAEPLPLSLIRLGLSNPVSDSDIKASTLKNSRIGKLTSEVRNNTSAEKPRKLLTELSSKLSRAKPNISSTLFNSPRNPSPEVSEIRKSDLPTKDIPKFKTVAAKSDNKKSTERSNASNDKLLLDMDKEDASSETGTYTIEKDNPDVEKARKKIDDVFGMDGEKCVRHVGICSTKDFEQKVGSGAPEWIREWAEQAAQLQQHKKSKDLNPLTDTQLFLQETENVVSAMQERVTRNLSNNNSSHNSDSDDEATLSHSPPKMMNKSRRPISTRASPLPREASVLSDSGYQIGYQSDSSNEGLREYKNIGAKMNKPFNVRRGRVGYESDGCAATALNRHSLTLPVRGISPRPPVGSISAANTSFARNDGGRYSLRMPKSRTPPNQMAPPIAKPRASPAPGPRTNSNSGKVDYNANRKSTPQISSGGGMVNIRKPPTGSRSNSTLTAKEVELANWKRRKSYDPMRAAQEGRKKRETCSAIETSIDDVTPTSLSRHSAAVMSKSMSFQMESNFSSKCNSEEEDMIYVVDEMDSSHSNSPIHIPMSRGSTHSEENHYYGHGVSHPALRPKNKLEALDNLVIATIHSLSNKVRTSSRQLFEKLQMQHADNENGALLEEMVSQLKELEMSSSSSSPNKSPSRELSGTLKNLKKLEQVILVLDRVLCDDSGSDFNT